MFRVNQTELSKYYWLQLVYGSCPFSDNVSESVNITIKHHVL